MANSNLANAKRIKNDEFYTQYPDIQKEIEAYLEFDMDTFKDKEGLQDFPLTSTAPESIKWAARERVSISGTKTKALSRRKPDISGVAVISRMLFTELFFKVSL